MALNILIDGYNLIGVLHKDLERERINLIERLKRYSSVKGHLIVIVFDGHRTGQTDREVKNIQGIRIIYTKTGESADDFITSLIKDSKLQWVVITSDRSIQKEAWSHNCIPIDSQIFEKAIYRTIKDAETPLIPSHSINETTITKISDEDKPEEENIYIPTPKKGSSKKLSKKEKSIMRILERL